MARSAFPRSWVLPSRVLCLRFRALLVRRSTRQLDPVVSCVHMPPQEGKVALCGLFCLVGCRSSKTPRTTGQQPFVADILC